MYVSYCVKHKVDCWSLSYQENGSFQKNGFQGNLSISSCVIEKVMQQQALEATAGACCHLELLEADNYQTEWIIWQPSHLHLMYLFISMYIAYVCIKFMTVWKASSCKLDRSNGCYGFFSLVRSNQIVRFGKFEYIKRWKMVGYGMRNSRDKNASGSQNIHVNVNLYLSIFEESSRRLYFRR